MPILDDPTNGLVRLAFSNFAKVRHLAKETGVAVLDETSLTVSRRQETGCLVAELASNHIDGVEGRLQKITSTTAFL